MNKKLKAIMSLPYSIWFNVRYLPLRQACKMPILIAYNVKNRMIGSDICFGMIHIGFYELSIYNPNDKTILDIKGVIEFKGTAAFGEGTKIRVTSTGKIVFGNKFMCSGHSTFICQKKMSFGNNVLFSWDCLTMDTDRHKILDNNGNRLNNDQSVVIGDNVWVGCRATILKGCVIPSNCVVGACSVISGQRFAPDTVIVGTPPASIKVIGGWKI